MTSENRHSPKKPRSVVLEKVYNQKPTPKPAPKNVPTSRGL